MTSEAAHLNWLAGEPEASLWDRCEENPPDAYCEDCFDELMLEPTRDWELVKAGRYRAVWKYGRCGNQITQEDE